ncbi:MAG: glycosyltransferase family 4 protein [Parcubacteria group bacterium]|nr:glycosyltransferase family 4 protein [Parcubacteria group bacterium]
MRIAIDGTTLCASDGSRGAGIEHYTWNIVSYMARAAREHELFIATPPALTRIRRAELEALGPNVTLLPSYGPKLSFVSRHGILPIRMGLRRPEVLFSPFGQVPLAWRGKTVVTVHDLAIYEHPEWFEDRQDFSTRVLVPKSLERADAIIAVSKATEAKLHELFPYTEGMTHVVHEGVDLADAYSALEEMDAVSTRFPYDRDFVLYLGTVEPRKNLINAFKAFDRFLESRPEQASDVRFIVAGKKGWHTTEIEEELMAVNNKWSGVEPTGVIQFLGPVTEQEKWTLMARASCLLYPSFDEGFGLPVLEAMAVGTPVITSNRGALPEVGGDAAMYFEPEDVDGMSLALTQCLLVPEGVYTLLEEGITRAASFSWEKAAEQTLGIIETVGQKTTE